MSLFPTEALPSIYNLYYPFPGARPHGLYPSLVRLAV